MKENDVKAIVGAHNRYYDSEKKAELEALTLCYKGRLLKSANYNWSSGETIEPALAVQYIEQYMASLFPKAPAVVVEHAGKAEGSAKLVESVCNRFLYDKQGLIEKAMRLAFIYPFSFIKLGTVPADSVLDAVDMQPVKPWDCVLDLDAETFERSRYVGHRLWMPLVEAKRRFPGKQFDGVLKSDLFDNPSDDMDNGTLESSSEYALYIEVYEVYDLLGDEVIYYSEQSRKSSCIVDRKSPIPFRDHADRPVAPMIDMYFDYDIVQPLRGASHLARIFDQVLEISNLHTQFAHNIRRDSRQFLVKKGVMNEEAKGILSENEDGSFVEVELNEGEYIQNVVMPVPQLPFSPNVGFYQQILSQDMQAASLLGSFTKGEATGVSATEASAITQYTSSEIGKLARIRDSVIERLCQVYTSIIACLLDVMDSEEGENVKEIHTLDGSVEIIRAQDFIGRFRFAAADQANTPMSSARKKEELLTLMPVLQSLGVPTEAILDQMIRLFDFPSTFKPKVKVEEQEVVLQPGPESVVTGAPPGAAEPLPVGGGEVAADIRAGGIV